MCLLEKVTSETPPHIFICYPIFLDDIIDDMICMVNTDTMFVLGYVDIKELNPPPSWKV